MCYFATYIFNSKIESQDSLSVLKNQVSDVYQINQDISIIGNKFACEMSGCFCGTVLLENSKNEVDDSFETEIRLLLKKGWKESKINRWLEEKKEKYFKRTKSNA